MERSDPDRVPIDAVRDRPAADLSRRDRYRDGRGFRERADGRTVCRRGPPARPDARRRSGRTARRSTVVHGFQPRFSAVDCHHRPHPRRGGRGYEPALPRPRERCLAGASAGQSADGFPPPASHRHVSRPPGHVGSGRDGIALRGRAHLGHGPLCSLHAADRLRNRADRAEPSGEAAGPAQSDRYRRSRLDGSDRADGCHQCLCRSADG